MVERVVASVPSWKVAPPAAWTVNVEVVAAVAPRPKSLPRLKLRLTPLAL